MKKDLEIQKSVMEELKFVPLLKASEIGVSVKNGVVTLSGTVDNYPQKIRAERAARRVAGVKGVAEDIRVNVKKSSEKSDSELAQAVLHELEWHINLDPERIRFLVEDGVVTLGGNVDWDFQRRQAAKIIGNLTGVRGVTNNIKISALPVPGKIQNKISSAFQRSASIDASRITVETEGHKVVLRGHVRNWYEKQDAEHIAWQAPGVTAVENLLETEEELVY